jgi:hypothetical protein
VAVDEGLVVVEAGAVVGVTPVVGGTVVEVEVAVVGALEGVRVLEHAVRDSRPIPPIRMSRWSALKLIAAA